MIGQQHRVEKAWLLKYGSFRQNWLNLASFPFSFGNRVCLASVAVDDVRDVINVSSAEVPDAKVLKMIKHAEVTFELISSRFSITLASKIILLNRFVSTSF
jgi:hypothetical protein